MNPRGTRENLVASHPENASALRSGVYSPRTLAPRAREIADALLAAPQAVPLDQLVAEEIGSLAALAEAIDVDLVERGLTDRGGKARSLLDYRLRVSGRLERWANAYGLTPASRVEWAGSLGRAEAVASAVREELQRGRKLREQAAERGALDPVPAEGGEGV